MHKISLIESMMVSGGNSEIIDDLVHENDLNHQDEDELGCFPIEVVPVADLDLY